MMTSGHGCEWKEEKTVTMGGEPWFSSCGERVRCDTDYGVT